MSDDEGFSREVLGRLAAMERSQAWLARKLNYKSPSALHYYVNEHRPWPRSVKVAVALVLDIRSERGAAA